ncbi:hypothetical protein ACFOMD_08750 [Sphingoaurantiacus capsulatus]|uniref:Uncharacterized protein n=1 Tax=Sphingoaurantiacus capsulatus TaxID=1771310 RepID=A0ABV7XBN1_9SPHN
MRLMAIALLTGLLIAAPEPAHAQRLDPSAIVTPAEREHLPELLSIMAEYSGGDSAARLLPRLEAVLAKLIAPTPLRGYVQFTRADMLMQGDSDSLQVMTTARQSIDEAIRLLPAEAVPKYLGAIIHTYGGNPARAADLWLTVSRDDPALAASSDRDLIEALVGRLRDGGDTRRADLLAARLSEIGFVMGDAGDQAALAMSSLRAKMRAGDVAGAQALVPSLYHPDQFAMLLVDKEFTRLWPAIENWAGARLERQWAMYAAERKRDWEASRALGAARGYAGYLRAAGDDAAVIDLFLPILSDPALDDPEDDAPSLAPLVATSLAVNGRLDDGLALLRKLAEQRVEGRCQPAELHRERRPPPVGFRTHGSRAGRHRAGDRGGRGSRPGGE